MINAKQRSHRSTRKKAVIVASALLPTLALAWLWQGGTFLDLLSSIVTVAIGEGILLFVLNLGKNAGVPK